LNQYLRGIAIMSEVVALGEVLIDFTPAGFSPAGNPIFERNPGGAPANVLAMLSKLGITTSFCGKVGDDLFGHDLKNILEKAGIETKGLILSKDFNTTFTFVELSPDGDRNFGFIRKHGADKELTIDEVDLSILSGARLFHFGGVSLTEEPARSATLHTAGEAKKRGLLISYDPNFREPLWREKDAVGVLSEGLKYADILKVSDEECRLLSGIDDLCEGAEYISKTYGTKIIFVTMGAEGSAYYFKGNFHKQRTFDVKTVDTTGAGDAFFGAMLYRILKSKKELPEFTASELDEFLRFANAAGSLVTTQKGAIMSMPDIAKIEDLIKNGRIL